MKFSLLAVLLCGMPYVPQLYGSQLKDVKSVYFYPMPGGFEQQLASAVASGHVFQVVSDPKLADAVFTDQLNDLFLYKLDHIHTPARPAAAAAPAPTATANTNAPQQASVIASLTTQVDVAPHGSSFTRGKGTLFLVDAKTKEVIWSTYQKPKNTSARELHKNAKQVVEKLEVSTGMKPESH